MYVCMYVYICIYTYIHDWGSLTTAAAWPWVHRLNFTLDASKISAAAPTYDSSV